MNDHCPFDPAVEYTLVGMGEDPVKPFPLQILEALSAYRYLVHTMNVPPEKILLVGDSAGGHLVLALQRYLLESRSMQVPGGLILLSPWVDLSV